MWWVVKRQVPATLSRKKDTIITVQEVGGAARPVWTDQENLERPTTPHPTEGLNPLTVQLVGAQKKRSINGRHVDWGCHEPQGGQKPRQTNGKLLAM